jgi:hypothetical protein
MTMRAHPCSNSSRQEWSTHEHRSYIWNGGQSIGARTEERHPRPICMPWQDLPKFSAVSVGAGQSIVCPTLPDGRLVSHLYTRRGIFHNARERKKIMQYMITWNERQQGSPIEYENAQKRILEVFSPWRAPANFKIQSFVIRVGDFAS